MNACQRIQRRDYLIEQSWPQSVPPLLQRIYSARGAYTPASAQPKLTQLLPPEDLLGIDNATMLLSQAIANHQHIVIVGDFDCDGATACAVAVRGLRLFGATHVSYAIPNRMTHGYGLSKKLVSELAQRKPDLLITVDHGITCHDGVKAAKALGWTVLITDHHLPGDQLPSADAIINPNQVGDRFDSKMLAGVGVIFYLLLALRIRLRKTGKLAQTEPDLAQLLDLVAVGTIADMVPLDDNNRALVSAGLRRLRAGHACHGLNALIARSGRCLETLTAADIGFALAPRINAAGRLQDMTIGVACLLSDDLNTATQFAQVLDQINTQRRDLQKNMLASVDHILVEIPSKNQVAHCLFDRDWHPGIIGLIASNLKDKYYRPVIAFAPSEPESELLRGSARSIRGFHIRDALVHINASHPGLITQFGGHAMAAGLTLQRSNLPEFNIAFKDYAARILDVELLRDTIYTDGALLPAELTSGNARILRDAGPWGQQFPEPLFDGEFSVICWQTVAKHHLKFKLALGDRHISAIEFNGWSGKAPPERIRVAYHLMLDAYRGGDAIQLIIVYRENSSELS